MGGEVSARGIARDQVLLVEKRLGASVVSGCEMNLGEPKGIIIVLCGQDKLAHAEEGRETILEFNPTDLS
jgi:hypothetical protein